MDIGIFGSATTIDGLRTQIESAAKAGFGTFWTPQIFDMDALTALAVISQSVPDIRLGTAVVPTYPRHPMMLAQQALTVNQACGGRLDLGIGLSHQPVVEGMWGIPFERPVRHMSDYLEILMPLLTDGNVSFGGEMVTGRGAINVPAEAPPVYVAALGPQMLKLAGKKADGTLTWMTGRTTIKELTSPTIRAAAEAAGRPTTVLAGVPVMVTSDPAAARERAAKDFEIYGQLPSYRAMLDREGYDGPEDIAVVGSIDEIGSHFQEFADAGVDQMVASVFGNHEEVAATVEGLATLL